MLQPAAQQLQRWYAQLPLRWHAQLRQKSFALQPNNMYRTSTATDFRSVPTCDVICACYILRLCQQLRIAEVVSQLLQQRWVPHQVSPL
jgi:phenylalanyl-tRNA synthetase beta subunit